MGVDPLAVLRCRDPAEQIALDATVRKAAELQARRDKAVAQRIAGEVMRGLSKAFK